jgi:NADH-quinone oxidoreductase subunit F
METTASKGGYHELKAEALDESKRLRNKPVILVGTATCGVAAGALTVKEAIEEVLLEKNLEAEVVEVGCLGLCYAEPLVVVAKPGSTPLCYGNVQPELARRLVYEVLVNDDPCYEFALVALEPNDEFPTFSDFPRGVHEQKIILEHGGFIDPENINQYIARDGYAALAKALTMTPQEVIAEITSSRLRGRGGAGFPAGIKWQSGRLATGVEKYVICNGDEGDPGAFMDRSILESNPHQVLEGLAISAYAVGAKKGIFYIRAEYPRAIQKVHKAIEQAREKGFVGNSILGSTFDFEVEVFQGSGAFVCGESSALVSSMEGNMGIPRHRPPRLSVSGYQGKPTIINNVKTLCYVPPILNRGAEWFASIGAEECPGTAVFTLVGKVTNTGLVEVPMGTTLRQLIFDVGEGIPGEKHFKAVQIGGPSGGCLPESMLDIPIDFDSLKEAGAIMGSGGLVVLDEDDCMVSVARYFLEFTQQESCGKCTFCRLGTRHMLAILETITAGEGTMESLTVLQQLAEDVAAGSLCNLGRTAPNPVLTTLKYFRDEYEAHILEKRCPSRRCKELILYYIEPSKCTKLCNVCVGSCPTEAIYTREDGIKVIDQEKCVKCNNCLKACPPEHDAVVKLSPPVLPAEKGRASS